jgi:hypothetical protein
MRSVGEIGGGMVPLGGGVVEVPVAVEVGAVEVEVAVAVVVAVPTGAVPVGAVCVVVGRWTRNGRRELRAGSSPRSRAHAPARTPAIKPRATSDRL